MREPRQIKRLCQLGDGELFLEVARGVNLAIENARTYQDSFNLLVIQQPGRAARHLHSVAEEEAAKVLILLDAIRCPRRPDPSGWFSRQLGYFNQHLPRGIYAWYAAMKPATFAEAREIISKARQPRYYEGEQGEFECRNHIIGTREEDLYVDYVKDGEACQWVSPSEMDIIGGQDHPAPSHIIDLADALVKLGCGTAAGLRFVAEKWRQIVLFDDLDWYDYKIHNIETIDFMIEAGLSEEIEEWHWRTVVDCWGYPLYPFELSELRESTI